MKSPLTLALLNKATLSEFQNALADIFEHSAWIPERAWEKRPFLSIAALHNAMVQVVEQSSRAEQLSLIKAHPELAGKEAATGTLTSASSQEQSGAGLQHCSAQEFAQLRSLNAEYQAKFDFPFIVAVKGLTRYDILQALEHRLQNDESTEFATALRQIAKIAKLRLDAKIIEKA